MPGYAGGLPERRVADAEPGEAFVPVFEGTPEFPGVTAERSAQLRGVAAVAAQDPGPYLWGGAGPAGYDADGIWLAFERLGEAFSPFRAKPAGPPQSRWQRLRWKARDVRWAVRHWREYRLVHESRVDR